MKKNCTYFLFLWLIASFSQNMQACSHPAVFLENADSILKKLTSQQVTPKAFSCDIHWQWQGSLMQSFQGGATLWLAWPDSLRLEIFHSQHQLLFAASHYQDELQIIDAIHQQRYSGTLQDYASDHQPVALFAQIPMKSWLELLTASFKQLHEAHYCPEYPASHAANKALWWWCLEDRATRYAIGVDPQRQTIQTVDFLLKNNKDQKGWRWQYTYSNDDPTTMLCPEPLPKRIQITAFTGGWQLLLQLTEKTAISSQQPYNSIFYLKTPALKP